MADADAASAGRATVYRIDDPRHPDPLPAALRATQPEQIVRIAQQMYALQRTSTDEPYALPREGPRIALMLRGSRDSLRATLAREYRALYGRTPTPASLAAAMIVLHGHALEAEPIPVHLRVAEHDGGIVVDLGRHDGRVVLISASGWAVLDRSPVIYRRSPLTGELPIPERGGGLDELRSRVHVTDETWPLVLGWLVAAYMPRIPHPVLLLGGEHGAGKTMAARALVSVIDPSPAPVRAEPRDIEGWTVAAAGSWVVAIDNVSSIPAWWSDCLCRAVTGDGLVRRALYTDSDISVIAYHRVIALTSIDAGALRGDLGDRILLADLTPIPPAARRTETEIDSTLSRMRPRILGALLDLLAGTLRHLPDVHLRELPRMADFARVLAAMDRASGTRALPLYLAQAGRIAAEIIDGDPVAEAIRALPRPWSGTAGDLYRRLTPDRLPHGWPRLPRLLTSRLRRLRPNLRQIGIDIDLPDQTPGRGRLIHIVDRPDRSASSASSASTEGQSRADKPSDRADGADDVPLAARGSPSEDADRADQVDPSLPGTSAASEAL